MSKSVARKWPVKHESGFGVRPGRADALTSGFEAETDAPGTGV
jgi:hypothetical protein